MDRLTPKRKEVKENMKTKETEQLEHDIRAATRKVGVFGCFEVTIGYAGKERVDFMTYEPAKKIFRCYEIKVTKEDFHSPAKKSFVGDYNYFVLTEELWETVKDEIPAEIGVYVGQNCRKKAKRSTLPDTKKCEMWRSIGGKSTKIETPLREVLLESMVRSLYRDSDKLLQTHDEQLINRLKQRISKAEKDNHMQQLEYNHFFQRIADKYGYDEAWTLAAGNRQEEAQYRWQQTLEEGGCRMTENEAKLILDVRISRFDHADDVNKALEVAKTAIEEIQQYRAVGTVEECREAREIKKKITEIVNQQLIAGKDNYKEVYSCFYDIVKVIQDSY